MVQADGCVKPEGVIIVGYFSNLAIDNDWHDDDRSYPCYEEQLRWRLDDLRDRLEELTMQGAPYCGQENLYGSDLRYALPKSFGNLHDVQQAMDLVARELSAAHSMQEGLLQILLWHPGIWRIKQTGHFQQV